MFEHLALDPTSIGYMQIPGRSLLLEAAKRNFVRVQIPGPGVKPGLLLPHHAQTGPV